MTIYYGKVIGRFLGLVEDGSDLDENPDFSPLGGTVTFTPAVTKVLGAGEDPPVSIYPQVVKATLDTNGYLTHNFKKGVKLLAPTEDVNPSGWTWTVSFDLKQGTKSVPTSSFTITVPPYEPGPDTENPDVGSTAVDLALVAPVPSSTGSAVVRGERGYSAYEIAVSNGFVGTEEQWLDSLVGVAPFERVLVVTGEEARPSSDFVIWVGGETQPTNMVSGDIWYQTIPEDPWVNRTQIQKASNGTSSHSVDFAAATEGNLLVMIACAAVTITASGWTKILQANTDLAVFTKTASASESSVSVGLSSTGYPLYGVVYEFGAGSTYVSGVQATGLLNTAPNPELSGLTGTNLTFAAVSVEWSGFPTATVDWSGEVGITEDVDISLNDNGTQSLSVAYVKDNANATFQPTGTINSDEERNKKAISFAVNVV